MRGAFALHWCNVADPLPTSTLSTPVAWTDADGRVAGANLAFARWLGVSAKRLAGVPLAAFEFEGDALARFLGRQASGARLRRMPLAFPGTERRASPMSCCRARGRRLVARSASGRRIPGRGSRAGLPSALSAALKGLAHELRNPLAGLKGAAQLLARRVAKRATRPRELTG